MLSQKRDLEKLKTFLNSDHCFHCVISEALVITLRSQKAPGVKSYLLSTFSETKCLNPGMSSEMQISGTLE
jgi:hypothetical protein